MTTNQLSTQISGRATGSHPFVADTRLAVARAWPDFSRRLARVAQRMTRDPDEQQDLLQTALIELWKTDPTRFELDDPDERAYLTRILVYEMWHAWGGERNRFRAMADVQRWSPTPSGRLAP